MNRQTLGTYCPFLPAACHGIDCLRLELDILKNLGRAKVAAIQIYVEIQQRRRPLKWFILPLGGGGKIQTPRGPEICLNSDVPGTALHTPCSVTLTHLLDIWSNQDLINYQNWALTFPRHPTKMSLFQLACKAGLEKAFGWSDPGD